MENSRKEIAKKYFLFMHFLANFIFANFRGFFIKFDAQLVHVQVYIKISHIFDQIQAFIRKIWSKKRLFQGNFQWVKRTPS